jgi:hypothetical protein
MAARRNITIRESRPDLPQLDDRLAAIANRPANSLQEAVATHAIWRLATVLRRDERLNRDPVPAGVEPINPLAPQQQPWTVPEIDDSRANDDTDDDELW